MLLIDRNTALENCGKLNEGHEKFQKEIENIGKRKIKSVVKNVRECDFKNNEKK